MNMSGRAKVTMTFAWIQRGLVHRLAMNGLPPGVNVVEPSVKIPKMPVVVRGSEVIHFRAFVAESTSVFVGCDGSVAEIMNV